MTANRVMVHEMLNAVPPAMHHEIRHALTPLIMDLAPVRCTLCMRIQDELITAYAFQHQVHSDLLPPCISLSQVIYLQAAVNEINDIKPLLGCPDNPNPKRVKGSREPTPIKSFQMLSDRRLPVPISEDVIEVSKCWA